MSLAATAAPVIALVLVPANTREFSRAYGAFDCTFAIFEVASILALGALTQRGGYALALPFLCCGLGIGLLVAVDLTRFIRTEA